MTFQLVTGPKTDHLVTGNESDHWLVKTVGVLVSADGLVLLAAAWRGRANAEVAILAIGSAVGLTLIDVIYVTRGTISSIYLVDAGVEVAFVAAWVLVLTRGTFK